MAVYLYSSGRRVICGNTVFGDEVALHYVTVLTCYLDPSYYLGGALQNFRIYNNPYGLSSY
ncbi:hypothetical protein DPMN_175096 [Dreissena polymorpha]|uniref:Uncharacterized protein n=1 Tax=Dreissena polymorpha TaxID=45954 RepID=A0A9D4E6L2_DREPO|nr:hypothetical protein DPMN_175096 [Dreissena polymorpha]